jgi:hypothetical protein
VAVPQAQYGNARGCGEPPGVPVRPRPMKPWNPARAILVSAFVCAAAAACGSGRGADLPSSVGNQGTTAVGSSGAPSSGWLAAAQLPGAAKHPWTAVQQPAAVERSKFLEAVAATNFPTAPAACRLPATAIRSSARDESDLLFQQGLPSGLLGSAPGQEGAAQFLMSYSGTGAAEQAAAQITAALDLCAKSLNQTVGTNNGARGRLSDPSGGSFALAAQLGQAEPQCIDVYVVAHCTTLLARPLAAGVALEADAQVTTQLPGMGAEIGGYVQLDAVYLVQRGDVVSILFVDAPLGWGTSATDPAPVLQAMAADLAGATGR